MPLIFVVALATQQRRARTTSPSAATCTTAGLAIPLVLLLFGSIWMFPLITALVAGDIVAAEDHNGTLKTILTRSLERGQIFAGKALAAVTYAIAAIAAHGRRSRSSAGSIASGFNPLTTPVGHDGLRAATALALVGASLLVYLMPMLAIACIGLLLSTVTRNSAAAVVGTLMFSLLMQLIGILPGLEVAAAVPAEHAVQRLAGAAARAGRLGADRPRRLGLLALRAAGAVRGATSSSCAATSPAAEAAETRPGRRRRSAAAAHARAHAVAEGFRSRPPPTAAPRWRRSRAPLPDVVVLDVAMPGMDGLAVCRRLRAKGMTAPVLMLTARDAVADRVRGLEAGADDYLVKPFAIEELVARIRALTRRGAPATEPLRSATSRSTARRARRRAAGADRAQRRARRSCSSCCCATRAASSPASARSRRCGATRRCPNVVDRYVARLRRKLGEPPLIRTVRGVGFMLRAVRRAHASAPGSWPPRSARSSPRWRCSASRRARSRRRSCAPRWTGRCEQRAARRGAPERLRARRC